MVEYTSGTLPPVPLSVLRRIPERGIPFASSYIIAGWDEFVKGAAGKKHGPFLLFLPGLFDGKPSEQQQERKQRKVKELFRVCLHRGKKGETEAGVGGGLFSRICYRPRIIQNTYIL